MQMVHGKIAAVFAASGEIAGAVARSLAQQGAKVYVSARNQEAVNKLATDIIQNGGQATAAKVDALHENEIDQHLQQIVHENGKLDIVFNGIGMNQADMNTGNLAADISLEQFLQPVAVLCGSQFLTARTGAKYMIETKSEGTILMFTAALSRLKAPFTAAITAACTAIEGLTRVLAAELGQHQIKVICLNSGAILETKRIKTNNTSLIMNKSAGVIKHLLIDARKTLTTVFENRCALINKNGTCHQCSQLNGLYNPKQDQQEALMKVELHNASKKFNREELFELRTRLGKAIDPLRASGTDLHDMMLTVTKMAIGESDA